ncbi:S15/NS1, RNA-binding protein [Tasmannia lanceolata]|uniref:S15/NS1, RNA-binding protein n=1 Tax=Tasmannia lanceolata TaxID=3420 RepID=UPI004062992C
MAAMALQLRFKCRTLQNPRFTHLFYSSSSSPPSPPPPPNDEEKQKESISSFSSYFTDVKESLRKSSSPPPRRIPRSPSSDPPHFLSSKPYKVASLDEIHKNLSEFRRRSAAPDAGEKPPVSSSPPLSFQDIYKSNVIEKPNEVSGKSGKLTFDEIHESLKKLRAPSNQSMRGSDRGSQVLDPFSLSVFKESLKRRPQDSPLNSSVIGRTESLPTSIFGKELGAKSESKSEAPQTEFLKMYNYKELGEKLRKLRPEVDAKEKNWFSLDELNERLKKLRVIEEKEAESRIAGVSFKDLRDSLVKLKNTSDANAKKSSMARLSMLGQLVGQATPSFMHSPPKDELVEKYFHPDNMSSEEKLKLDLKRVRDEFKMSESDCGSSRVQVAQLTTKIKHLSSVLHKKDKHSRKGLQAMVQRRKKLLKYLRRTDWDSYCFVLSKLGLRDNPDYKN